jgi:type II secretory pathway component GspD/PulD (secretin)
MARILSPHRLRPGIFSLGIGMVLLALAWLPGVPARAQGELDEGSGDHQLRVRVRVRVLEWRLQNQLDTGFTLRYLRDVESGNNIAAGDATFPSGGGRDGLTAFFDRIRFGPGELELAIQALEQSDRLRVLSEPVLTVNASAPKPATFFSGREIPYETLRISEGVLLSVTEFRETGILLKIENPEVFLFQGDPEQRFVRMNFNVDVTRPGPEIPVGVNKQNEIMTRVRVLRRALTTELFIPENSPFIAGIIKSRLKTENTSGIPYLSEIPYIGPVFRSNSLKEQDTELIFLVTSEILWPDNPPHDVASGGLDLEEETSRGPVIEVPEAEAAAKAEEAAP